MLKSFLRWLFTKIYKVKLTGLKNYNKAGKRVLIVANHLSFLDGLLLALFLPGKPLFTINSAIASRWYLKIFRLLAKVFPLDPTNPMATKSIIHEIRKNQKCIIFPEGRITATGSLMKIYEGPGMIADKSGAKVLPVRIDGTQYTPFSHLKGKVRIRWFPKITLTILEPQTFDIPKKIQGRARRYMSSTKLYDIMSEMMFSSSDCDNTLFQTLLDQSQIHGRNCVVLEDTSRKPLNYGQVITRSFILGDKFSKITNSGEYVGIFLPNMVNSVITFFALQAYGRTPAMLNFATGMQNLISACRTAEIKKVLTSRKFIEVGNLTPMIKAMEKEGVSIVYLEDIAKTITIINKLVGYFRQLFYKKVKAQKSSDSCVVLFTSGSEGTPKAVVLSHTNIQANCFQLRSRVDFRTTDNVFNALPIFHVFGLTGGVFLPLFAGIKVFLYPSPLHYRIIPELIYDTNSTILFGTDTFLFGYARYADLYDFYSIRYVFAGAEKLKEETRKLWSEKYGVRIFEAYGTTETSPGLSINTPMYNKPGTVGRLLPFIHHTLENVPGIDDGGKLIVSGPNIMKGYMFSDNPGVLVPPKDNKYDTGDIVSIDEEGYVTIKGRAKRFAKIAGEMISLVAVEAFLYKLWPNNLHAVMGVSDSKKGEALMLVTDNPNAKRKEIHDYAKEYGIGELSLPRNIKIVKKIPLLGVGKVDYFEIQKLINRSIKK
jgi:acyl-[acyl-carrier-protein]-phospholipid O-acyltransferase / long-chain-fatty-acid--[acyl-carrier-protein] ligase